MPPKGSGKKGALAAAKAAAAADGSTRDRASSPASAAAAPTTTTASGAAARERPTATSSVPYVPQGDHLFRFTSFNVIGYLNGKNVAADYVKSDAQSFWSRRPNDDAWEKEREGKRRRLMASEEEILAAEPDGDDGDASRVRINVLAKGKELARPPKELKSKTRDVHDDEDELDGDNLDEHGRPDIMSRTIVIHPGSQYLRIGRASDHTPVTIPNVIATKRTTVSSSAPVAVPEAKQEAAVGLGVTGSDEPLPQRRAKVDRKRYVDEDGDEDMLDDEYVGPGDESDGERDPNEGPVDPLSAKITSIRGDLRARMRYFKLRGQGSANSQAIAYNEEVVPEPVPSYNDPNEEEWTDTKGDKAREFYVGNEALAIPDPEAEGYVLKHPFDRGAFNTSHYSSSQEFLGDIQRIWLTALEGELGISKEELKDFSAILIIPDLYDHIYVREMVDLVLHSLGFKQICLQQESICATFGAGLSTACVIDIGAKKTSISCVEEGLVLAETRMVLDFAGDDITDFFLTLLKRTAFPYKEADLTKWHDRVVLEGLKERIVVLSEGDVGLNIYDFYVRKPGKVTNKYTVRVYDDCILAPYALFAPRVVEFDRKVYPPPCTLWSKDVDDIVDIGGDDPVTTAMKNSTKHLLPADPSTEGSNVEANAGLTAPATPSITNTPNPDDAATQPALVANGTHAPVPAAPTINVKLEASKLPLDVAVVESILAAGSEDRMKKLCQSLLIIGGTGIVHNVGFAVESRVGPQLSARVPSLANQTANVPPPREVDPRELAWKGVSVLPKLDSAADLWIRREDWDLMGMRAVKERCFFFG